MALLGFSVSLLPHLTLGFSAPLLPHQRHGPAVLAGCRTGRPAGCRAGRPALGARPLVRTQVIAYHKPAGLIVSHNDELDRPTVYEHLAEQPGFPEGRWDAVGRLDLNTSGLLLLTNDGWLLRHVTDPTSGTRLPKTYRVLASKVLGEAVLERLRSGVELGGGLGRSGPAQVSLLGHGKGSTRLRLTIHEGKNRQVRRMLHAVGSAVVRLERESVGTLRLGGLGVGAWRLLGEEEVRSHLEYEPRDLTPSRRAAPTTRQPPTTSRPPPPPLTAAAATRATRATKAATRAGEYPEGQYLLLDSGDQARLEVFDGRVLVRPCPSATWGRGLGAAAWGAARLSYVAAHKGGATEGRWRGEGLAEIEREIEREAEVEEGAAESAAEEQRAAEAAGAQAGGGAARWALRPRGLGFALALRPGSQGQLGAFPEQEANWRWLRAACEKAAAAQGAPPRVLNLFGYSGGSTLACAAGGASVVHVDGARAAIAQARRNAQLSRLDQAEVRWLCDDTMSYLRRAVRRGEVFDGVVADPPAFGRGGQGKKRGEWRIERDLPEMCSLLAQLLSPSPALLLLSCHDARWPAPRLASHLAPCLPPPQPGEGGAAPGAARLATGSMTLEAHAPGGKDLAMGCFVRWSPP